MLSALEYKYAHDFRGLVAYKAFSSDYIAVPLLDRESPYVSHCARARARIMENARFWISNEREGKSLRIWTRIDGFFVLYAIEPARVERGKKISIPPSTVSASFFRSRFPL